MATLPTGARPLLSPHVHVPVGAGTGGSGVAPSQRVPPKVPAPSPGLSGSGMLGGGDGAPGTSCRGLSLAARAAPRSGLRN